MASPMKLRPGIYPALQPAHNPRVARLRERVKSMPQEPGVYRWIDDKGEIIYVGKAKNLKQRLRSYVTPTPRVEHFRKRALLENMADLEVTFTSTEIEALVLEANLIRSLKPRYNVSLTREKHFVYVRFGMNETFPSIRLVHRKERDGAIYIGPHTNPWVHHRALEGMRSIYAFRDCGMSISLRELELFEDARPATIPLDLVIARADRRAPCLDYHIKRCSGPCSGDVLPDSYRTQCIDDILAFYRGDPSAVIANVKQHMIHAAEERRFERAGELRDILGHLEEMNERKKLFDPNAQSIDAFGFSRDLKDGAVLQSRGGNLANEERLSLESSGETMSSVLTQTLPQFYASGEDVPDIIALPSLPEDVMLLKKWLTSHAGHAVDVVIPRRGEYKRLVELASLNAQRKNERMLSADVVTV